MGKGGRACGGLVPGRRSVPPCLRDAQKGTQNGSVVAGDGSETTGDGSIVAEVEWKLRWLTAASELSSRYPRRCPSLASARAWVGADGGGAERNAKERHPPCPLGD